jgi:molecular chaperone GrpE
MSKDTTQNVHQPESTDAIEEHDAAELQKKCAEYELGWKRALADYENLKRDMALQANEARKSIKKSFAASLLPVIDNFQQAVHFAPSLDAIPSEARKSIETWLQGVMFIEKQFAEAMQELGVEEIRPDGQFDPHLHEAAEKRSEEGKVDGEILDILQVGWKMGEHVLRPAKVIVNEDSQAE